MSQKEIQQIEVSLLIIARAIESGRIDGVLNDVKQVLGYTAALLVEEGISSKKD